MPTVIKIDPPPPKIPRSARRRHHYRLRNLSNQEQVNLNGSIATFPDPACCRDLLDAADGHQVALIRVELAEWEEAGPRRYGPKTKRQAEAKATTEKIRILAYSDEKGWHWR